MEPSVMDRAVKAGGYVLHVRAVAGVESCCYVESVDVAFDIGRCFGRVVSKSHVFITHGHIDHIAAFAAHAGRRALQKMAPAKYYAPAHLVPHMQSIIDSFSVMQEDSIPAKIIPVEPHQEIHIDGKWAVRAFPTCHRVPSLGYIVYAKRNKLRADLVGRDSKDIAALRKAGESVTELDQSPAIAYTGDTTIDVFLHAAERGFGDLLRVKALVTEATYVDTHKTPADAESRGHIHLHQLIEHADLFAEVESLVLVHSSARYAAAEINEVIMAQLPLSLRDKTIVAGR